ncbi:hypothetical protein CJJ09_001921 [Candidozyma auris]|nr:hypothetical protein CJJ09_001921 [[Candida] auris]
MSSKSAAAILQRQFRDLTDPKRDPFPDSETWSPAQTVESVLISIVSLLEDPNISSPANIDASVELRKSPEAYKKKVMQEVARSKQDIPEGFVVPESEVHAYGGANGAAKDAEQEPVDEDFWYDSEEESFDEESLMDDMEDVEDDVEEEERRGDRCEIGLALLNSFQPRTSLKRASR